MSSPSTASSAWPTRQVVGAVLTPLSVLVLYLAPVPLEPEPRRLLPIVVGVLVAWVTEVVPIAVTALLVAPALVLAGVTDAKTAFAPYASPLLYVFVGGFFIARAMQRHGLDQRVAKGLLSMAAVGQHAARSRAALMLTAALLSMWISNTACTAILLPIAASTLRTGAPGTPRADRSTTGLYLAVAYAASVGGLGTPVGSPPNLITLKLLNDAGVAFDFLDWVMVGTPIGLLLAAVVFAYFQLRLPPADDSIAQVEPDARPLSRGEKVTAVAFGVAVVGWLLPGVATALDLEVAPRVAAHLPAGVVALVAASVLFVVRDEDREQLVLPWSDAARIDWGLILLFGGGISLGNQMFETGLAAALGRHFIEGTGVTNIWVLTALASLVTLLMTEACSNMATANMLVPLVIGIAQELGVSPVGPALAVGIAASCAFMLPIATGPNAIVYGTGRVPMQSMIGHGAVLNLLAWGLVVAYVRVVALIAGF